MNRPIILCSFRCHRVLHLGFDEELQDVGVFLRLVLLVVAAVSGGGRLRAQHQVAVVEATLHGFIHDVEPGPRLHPPSNVVLALIRLLQVLKHTGALKHTWLLLLLLFT